MPTLQPFTNSLFNELFLTLLFVVKIQLKEKSLKSIKALMFIEFYSVFGKNWMPEMKEQISYMEYVIDLMTMLHTRCGLSNDRQFQTVRNIILEKFKQEFEETTNAKYDIDACQFVRKKTFSEYEKDFRSLYVAVFWKVLFSRARKA